GMDTKMIHRAIRNNYGNKNIEADFPQKYLEKILQLSFHLPEISKEQRFNFVRDLFSAAAREKYEEKKTGTTGEGGDEQETPKPPPEPGKLFFNLTHAHKPVTYAVTEVEDTADELEAFNAYRYYLQDNPRELKRLVNIHRLVKILIHQDRELSWDAEKQQKFVKWTIFCSRWPKLVKKAIDKAKAPFPNCLKAIADGNTELQEFAGNQTGLLSSADIDADFIFAADMMQRIHHHAE
ncbi:MAG: hypothetical protein GY950_32400, partial [bacterium]|nr:hypothetical protein [bacterium]